MNELGSNHFFKRVKHFGQQEKKKIQRILIAAKTNGFEGLKSYVVDGSVLLVRNKSSNDVGSNDPKFMEKIRYVRQHALWHIHSGFYNVDNEYPIFDGIKNHQYMI